MTAFKQRDNELKLHNELWTKITTKPIDTLLYDRTRVTIPAYTLQIYAGFPEYATGRLMSDLRHAEIPTVLQNNKKRHLSTRDSLRMATIFEDEAIRDTLGEYHPMFYRVFGRNGRENLIAYLADFNNRSETGMVEGVNQKLLTRQIGWRLPQGDVDIGVTTIAPEGVVPTLPRKHLEKIIGADGLKRLGALRGKEIYEAAGDIVDVRNALGYPQLTMRHGDAPHVPHYSHITTPKQDNEESVSDRWAPPQFHTGRLCFLVDMHTQRDYERPNPRTSFQLVRTAGVTAKIQRDDQTIEILL